MTNYDEFDKIMQELNAKKNDSEPKDENSFDSKPEEKAHSFKLNIQDDEFEMLDRFEENSVKSEEPEYERVKADSPKKKKKQRKGLKLVIALLVTALVLAVCAYLAFFALDSANDLFGLNQDNREVEVVIPEGATTLDIISILKENKVISQPFTFRLYSKLKKADGTYQKGTYKLNANMPYDKVIYTLTTSSQRIDVVTVTFIEGMSINEIADLLEKNEVCKAEDFKQTLQTESFEYEFEELLPQDENIFYRFEGYVFPDTYTFYIGEHPKSVAKKFLDNFNNKISADLWERMDEMGLSLNETITLASIIQKESGGSDEMYGVSSVFHNRLEASDVFPSLQSDVTIFYVEDQIKPYLEEENQEMFDAYNTYVCEGIPVGPICNPGLGSIQAALYPADTKYYFFLTDVNGKFYYARTANEHLANQWEAENAGSGVDHGIDIG